MSNANWWADKLAQTAPQAPQGRPANTVPMPASQQPLAPMPTFQPTQAPTSRAQSANQTATCPDCGSGNYMAPTPQIAPRCYDCGYPVQQSGSRFGGLAGAQVVDGVTQATGNNSASNWNPQQIIGRIE